LKLIVIFLIIILNHHSCSLIVLGVENFVSKVLKKSVLNGKSSLKGEALVKWIDEAIDSLLIVLRGPFVAKR
jgi:hypothetical protein